MHFPKMYITHRTATFLFLVVSQIMVSWDAQTYIYFAQLYLSLISKGFRFNARIALASARRDLHEKEFTKETIAWHLNKLFAFSKAIFERGRGLEIAESQRIVRGVTKTAMANFTAEEFETLYRVGETKLGRVAHEPPKRTTPVVSGSRPATVLKPAATNEIRKLVRTTIEPEISAAVTKAVKEAMIDTISARVIKRVCEHVTIKVVDMMGIKLDEYACDNAEDSESEEE